MNKHFNFITLVGIFALAALLFAGVGVTSAAARAAIPGDALYPVKMTLEQTRLSMAGDAGERAEMKMAFAEQRLNEISALIAEGRYREINDAVLAFETHINGALIELDTLAKLDPARSASLAKEITTALTRYASALSGLVASAPADVRGEVARALTSTNTASSLELPDSSLDDNSNNNSNDNGSDDNSNANGDDSSNGNGSDDNANGNESGDDHGGSRGDDSSDDNSNTNDNAADDNSNSSIDDNSNSNDNAADDNSNTGSDDNSNANDNTADDNGNTSLDDNSNTSSDDNSNANDNSNSSIDDSSNTNDNTSDDNSNANDSDDSGKDDGGSDNDNSNGDDSGGNSGKGGG